MCNAAPLRRWQRHAPLLVFEQCYGGKKLGVIQQQQPLHRRGGRAVQLPGRTVYIGARDHTNMPSEADGGPLVAKAHRPPRSRKRLLQHDSSSRHRQSLCYPTLMHTPRNLLVCV